MSNHRSDRWYLVPATRTAGTTRPKYTDAADIDGFAGNTVPSITLAAHHGMLVDAHPDVDPWYVARFYGTPAALDAIAAHDDTRSLDTMGAVARVLNDRFPGVDRNPTEAWGDAFRVGPPD